MTKIDYREEATQKTTSYLSGYLVAYFENPLGKILRKFGMPQTPRAAAYGAEFIRRHEGSGMWS